MGFTVTSNSFKDGDYLPNDFILSADFGFGCAGGNKSPHLRWSDAPAGTKSFAVTCYDPDAPTGSGDGDPIGDGAVSVEVYRIDPLDLGLARATLDELRGGDAAVNAEAIRRVVAGDASPHRDIALLNSAAALTVIGRVPDLAAGIALACDLVDSGRAARVLDDFIRVTNEASEAERPAQ